MIAHILLNQIPEVQTSNFIEKIIDFKKDPDTIHKFKALRIWMNKIVKEDYKINELTDEIQYLIYEYEKHIKLHKLKYRINQLSVLFTIPFQFIANPKEAGNAIFSLFSNKIELDESEVNAPGREFAFIFKAKTF